MFKIRNTFATISEKLTTVDFWCKPDLKVFLQRFLFLEMPLHLWQRSMVSSKTFVSSQGESNNRGREKEAPVIHQIYDCLSLPINLQLLVAHYFKSIYVTSYQFTMIGLSPLQINLWSLVFHQSKSIIFLIFLKFVKDNHVQSQDWKKSLKFYL